MFPQAQHARQAQQGAAGHSMHGRAPTVENSWVWEMRALMTRDSIDMTCAWLMACLACFAHVHAEHTMWNLGFSPGVKQAQQLRPISWHLFLP